jgi:hypothetical protein
MNTLELNCAISNDKVLKQQVIGIFPINKIPLTRMFYPCGYIINTDVEGSPGKHWIAIYFINKNQADFFDSFGKSLNFYGIGQLGKGLNITYSSKVIQHEKSLMCGYYCLYFLYMKSRYYSLKQLQGIFTEDKTENDCLVFNFVDKTFDTCH